ncbi:hypothetical protein AVEN_59892-1 [Araneus ventricosus]|uniref:Mos1 transposase HTH domain-containing protein n=1 Tax=Araneus ventricosus TaxID=182803 RepID=A0A4Y2EF21_ARAVE|nr:hypothetical protein AVEN_59892-1 [Araneus ventricosus]
MIRQRDSELHRQTYRDDSCKLRQTTCAIEHRAATQRATATVTLSGVADPHSIRPKGMSKCSGQTLHPTGSFPEGGVGIKLHATTWRLVSMETESVSISRRLSLTTDAPAKCELRSVIRFLQAGLNGTAEIPRKMSRVYGENFMSDGVVREWCRKFKGCKSVATEDLVQRVPGSFWAV